MGGGLENTKRRVWGSPFPPAGLVDFTNDHPTFSAPSPTLITTDLENGRAALAVR